ncbi:MAG: tRNA 2-thiouridine(34) synthase MnmA [Ethanoligenens sp.]
MNPALPLAGKTVLAAMSGGVDSSVTAALLQRQGANVIGITLNVWPEEETPCARSCCSVTDVDDARAVCNVLGIPHYVLNTQADFKRSVIDYFTAEYLHGRTPNPCIACNAHVKFAAMLRKADEFCADYIATGHYARIERDGELFRLTRAADAHKDQTYVLYMLTQMQLGRILFPCGGYEKPQIRALAKEFGLPTFQKADSQDLCFIGRGGYAGFLRENCADLLRPGNIVDESGHILGQHDGVYCFTVGQHKGLGSFSDKKLYVLSINAERAEVHVGENNMLFANGALVGGLNRLLPNTLTDAARVQVKIRYNAPAVPATVYTQPDGTLRVEFDAPQRAVTPGQAAVFYDGDAVLGGGMIEQAIERDLLQA